MPLKSFIRRRLLSLLQPWLREEPHLDLQLGFLYSLAVLTNLSFDVSSLNLLFGAPAFLFIKNLTVDRITFRFSPWFPPAFTIELHGVRIVQSFEKPEAEECVARLRNSKYDYSDYLRKNLSELDPEGCSLHHILEKILFAVSEKKNLTISFWNLILKNCHLVAHHIHVEVQLPILNDEFMFFGEIIEFSARSKCVDQNCLLRGFLGTIFIPTKENTVILKGDGFRVRLIGKNSTDHALVSSDVKIYIKFRDLKLVNCTLCIPELATSVSPDGISACLLFHKLLSNKYNHSRSAGELWKIAASRIGHVAVTHRLSLYRLVGVIGQWINYLNAYENILLLFGYSTSCTWKKFISKMSHNKLLLSSARHHWELISDIEKKLPIEGISLARRIARHRAALKFSINCHEEFATTNKFFRPFLFILGFMWKVISMTIHCLANIFSGKRIVQDSDIDGRCLDSLESLIEDACQIYCLTINFGKIIMTVSKINNSHPSVYEKLQSPAGIVCSNVLSICFCIDALLLVSVDDIFEQKVFLSCGQMKVESTPPTMSADACTVNELSSAKGNEIGGVNRRESIMWVAPAKIFLLSEIDAGQTEDSCDAYIESFMEKLSMSWKRVCRKLNENEIEYSENPCLLSKVEISSTCQDHKNPNFGFCECGLMLGKLNLVLSHSSVSLLSLVLGKIEHGIYWEDSREVSIGSDFTDRAEIAWADKYDCYSKELIMILLQKLPEKHINFGVFFDGLSVRFSHRREANQEIDDIISRDNFDLTFDFHEIKGVVSTSSFDMIPLTGQLGHGNAKSECVKLEPRVIEIPKPNNGKYSSSGKVSIHSFLHLNGTNACLEKPEENHPIQLFLLKPITVHILSFRDCIYSLSTTMSAFSAACNITAEGFIVLSFLDEVYMIYKAVASLSSEVCYLFSSSSGDTDIMHPEIMKQESLFAAPDISETTNRRALLRNNVCPFFINVNCRFKSMEIVLHNSRTSDGLQSFATNFHSLTGNKMAVHKLPDRGIWMLVQHTTIEILCEERKMDLLTDLSGIFSFVFEYNNSIGTDIDHIVPDSLLLQSINCLHEISISGFSFTLSLGLVQNAPSSGTAGKTFGSCNGNSSYFVQETSLTAFESASDLSPQSVLKMGSPSKASVPASTNHWLLMDVAVSSIFIGRSSLKSELIQAHELNKLLFLLSIGGEFHMISWEIQGGFIFLETTSLPMAMDSYSSYLCYIGNLTSDAKQPKIGIKKEENARENYTSDDVIDHRAISTSQQAASRLPEACDFSLSHFDFVLVHENESGCIQEIVVEVDIHMNFELATTGRKLTIDLSRLSILSQTIQRRMEDESAIPHFSSVTSKDLSSLHASGDPLSGFHNFCELNSISDASSSKNTLPVQIISHENQILKNLRAFLSLERPDNGDMHLSQCWFGIGSLLGFDITLSISEIQTIMSMSSSLSEIASQNAIKKLERNHWSSIHDVDNCLEAVIPDGAIVAIQDVNQHMFFTVEGEEKTFRVGGIIHYSLVGERALFRVKHCLQRRWNSTVLWFSFISLFAKNDMGVPLRLNFRPGSCFVDICCPNDGGCALWSANPAQGENDVGLIDSEVNNQSFKRTFYLVNKKNDSAIAFVDGALEFVKKPGSPIKFKFFNDITAAYGASEIASYPRMATETTIYTDEEITSWQGGKHPCIDIKIEKVSLNIVHELSDTEYLFPLISLLLNSTQLNIQISAKKYRVISTSSAVAHYFDVERNSWGELLHPVEICLFYRSNIEAQLSEYRSDAVPVNYFCRMKELDVFLNENSLDMLLFVIGKLNLSGPYSMRNSIIEANCCKVENQSGLNLHVHFDQQSIIIPRKQSASILLRGISDFKNQDSEATSISIQLTDLGSFATSSNKVSLSRTQTLSWRTRIMSAEGSTTFPGPIFVVNITRNSEVGLSVVVSPLIRIHNGTGFSMELQFQRLEPKEDEFASLLLRPGDSIDDSMAMFDAINFSGGVKRALISLSVGNFLFSFRPKIAEELVNSESSLSLEWSDYIKGGKAVHLSGIFNKLNYRIRKALFEKSVKCSFSTSHCTLKSEGESVANMHFLIQTVATEIPVAPEKSAAVLKKDNPTVSLLEKKEIYLLPTVRMTNLLHSEIDVILSETDQSNLVGYDKIGKRAVISRGSTVDFYANPEVIYFTVTLTSSNSSSKPVNSGDCMKKFLKQNNDVHHLDINLDFDGGKFFATLRLYRGIRGVLEVVIFTSYSIKNDTDFQIFVLETKRSPLSRIEFKNLNYSIPSELGLYLPPKSTSSWFLKSEKVLLKLMEDHTSEALLDFGSLSGLAELSFEKEEGSGIKSVTKLGISIGPSLGEIGVPSQMVTLVPRYVICNESEECISVRQCYFQDEVADVISIRSKHRMPIQLKEGFKKTREFSIFEHFIRKHRSSSDNTLLYFQIQLNEAGLGWSGPVCIASLGHFFLKFRKQTNEVTLSDNKMTQFAAVHVVEEGSTLVSRFYRPPNMSLPYRIENCLHSLSITYYQKGLLEPEVLGPACSADYVWDDLTLPRRLVICINGCHLNLVIDSLTYQFSV